MNVEHFWVSLRQSMNNFYAYHKHSIRLPLTATRKMIQMYITLYAIDVMEKQDSYHGHILTRNILRLEKLFYRIHTYPNTVYMLLDIFEKNPDCHFLFKNILDILVHKTYEPFILFAIEHNKTNILDKLNKCINVASYINMLYSIRLYPNTSGIKMIKRIKQRLKQDG